MFPVDPCELEWEVSEIYRAAGLDPSEPASARKLAGCLLGPHAVESCARLDRAHYAIVDGAPLIRIPRGLPPVVEEMKLFHELCEYWWRARDCENKEQVMDLFAYMLRMPRDGFRRWSRVVGCNPALLSQPFRSSQTAVMLRWGEVHNRSVVVVTPAGARARGPEIEVPDVRTLRGIVKAKALDGLEEVRITDRKDSFAVLVG